MAVVWDIIERLRGRKKYVAQFAGCLRFVGSTTDEFYVVIWAENDGRAKRKAEDFAASLERERVMRRSSVWLQKLTENGHLVSLNTR